MGVQYYYCAHGNCEITDILRGLEQKKLGPLVVQGSSRRRAAFYLLSMRGREDRLSIQPPLPWGMKYLEQQKMKGNAIQHTIATDPAIFWVVVLFEK